MIKYLNSFLGIDYIPRWLFFHLISLAFVLGGFQAVIFIGSISGFISSGLLSYYPEAVALSGVLGVLMFAFFRVIKRYFTFRNAILFFLLILLFLLFLAIFLPKIITGISSAFFLFVIMIPSLIILEQILSGISENLPSKKYQQNIKRSIEAIYLISTAVFSIIILIFSKLDIKPVLFLVFLFLIGVAAYEINYILKKTETKTTNEQNEEIFTVISLFSDLPLKLVGLLVLLFLVLSTINLICIDYLFFEKLGNTYSGSSLVEFLSMFLAGLMCINLLFKLFVYQNLIKTFRINKALLLSSVFMLVVLGFLNIYYLVGSFNLFNLFLVVVFIRFFVYLLRESFELYSLRMVFTVISLYSEKVISYTVHNLINAWGFVIGGMFLLLAMSFDLLNTHTIIYLNTAIVLVWIVVSWILVKKYKSVLLKIIRKISEKTGNNGKTGKSLKDRVMLTTNLAGLKYLLNYQRYYQPFNFEKKIGEIPVTMQNQLGLTVNSVNPVEYITHLHEPAKFQDEQGSSMNYYDSDVSLRLTDIEALSSSSKIKDRIRAVKMIENSKNFIYSGIYKMLIRDSDEEVRRNAIMSAVTYYNSDILTEIIRYINNEEFSILVSEVLAKIGDDAISSLVVLFDSVESNAKIQDQVISIMGKIGSPKSISFLLEKLNYPNKWIIFETANALWDIKHKPDLQHNEFLHHAIIKTIGVAAWLLAKEVSIEDIRKNDYLKKALDDEFYLTIRLLFKLLQLKYANETIGYISDNFTLLKNNEQKEMQVELLRYIIDEDLQIRLFPLLHNNKKSEKIEQLKRFYPIQKKSFELTLRDLVNADFEYVTTWTRACALKSFIENTNNLEADEIIAHIFNPELIIAELVFFSIYKKNPNIITQISDRIPAKLKNRIFSVLKAGPLYEYSLIFNKVIYLQRISYFQKMMGHYLVPFAEVLSEIYLTKGELTYLKCSQEEVLPVFINSFGEIAIVDQHKRQIRLNQNFLYGLGLFAGGLTINAFSDSVMYIAQPEQIGYLVIHHEELSDAFFKYIQNSNLY